MNWPPLSSHLRSEKWNSDKRSVIAINENAEGTQFGFFLKNSRGYITVPLPHKTVFFPQEISRAFSNIIYYNPVRTMILPSGLWTPVVACAGMHQPQHKNARRRILSSSTLSHSPQAAWQRLEGSHGDDWCTQDLTETRDACSTRLPPPSFALVSSGRTASTACSVGQSSQPARAGAWDKSGDQSHLAPLD